MAQTDKQDQQYFDGVNRRENRPFYDWFSLAINFPYTEDVFNEIIQGKYHGEEDQKALTAFIHEYVHYLQNFGTLWGIPKFIDLVHSILLIHNSLVGYDTKYTMPFDLTSIKDDSLSDGLKKRAELPHKLNEYKRFHVLNQVSEILNYSSNTSGYYFAIISNDHFECNICMKTLKESQAFIAEKLLFGLSDEEIQNLIHKTFYPEKVKYRDNYFYWILFDFLKAKYPNLQEVGKGLFFLIQDCLNRANPCTAFKRFIDWLNSRPERLLQDINLLDLVLEWRRNLIEKMAIGLSIQLTSRAIDNFNQIINKHKVHDEFLYLLSDIINFSRKNMYEFNTGIFPVDFNFSAIPSWYWILERFGTGIIIFEDSKDDNKKVLKTLGSTYHQEHMHKAFKFLFSINLQFEMLQLNQDFLCPLLKEFPLCNFELDEVTRYLCVQHAFLVNSKKADETMCLFDNTAAVMGFKKSIRF